MSPVYNHILAAKPAFPGSLRLGFKHKRIFSLSGSKGRPELQEEQMFPDSPAGGSGGGWC